MIALRWPDGFRLERLTKAHRRKGFTSGQPKVDEWLMTRALQQQDKRLSVTKVLLDQTGVVVGYYTLATGQADFSDLPADIVRKLPHRALPVATLAWLGVATDHQGTGLGRRLLSSALRDCHDAGRTFAFIAVLLDCIDDAAKAFYQRFAFAELPGHPYRLYLSAQKLDEIVTEV